MSSLKQENGKTSEPKKINEVVPQSDWQYQNIFAIITWGGTGTSWISKVLNLHPEIFCVHELAIKLYQSKFYTKKNYWDEFDPIDFMKVIYRLSDHKANGDVHSIRPQDVPLLKEFFGKNFSSVVLEREPISRLKSQMANYKIWNYQKLWSIDYIDEKIKSIGISLPKFDYEHKLFVHGVNLLNTIAQEVNYNCGKMFRMEDLVSDPKYLKSLIKEISSGELSADDELLNKMIKTPATNIRASKEKIELEDWHIDVIKKIVNEKTWELYSNLGYSKPNFL